MFGVCTDYEANRGRKRDHVTVWEGPFADQYVASGVSLPRGNGYMLTLDWGDKVRVTSPTPRTDDNYHEVDAAINAALTAHYARKAA
jgi:hypothetical protein